MGYLTELVVPVATAADTDSYKKASRTVRWALTWKADAASPEWAFPRPRGPWRLRRRPATDRYAPRSQVLPAGHRRVGAARRGGGRRRSRRGTSPPRTAGPDRSAAAVHMRYCLKDLSRLIFRRSFCRIRLVMRYGYRSVIFR
ncbi:hypothetical protein DAI22_01g056008 [Oryza sativa Japonica Group]|nr:hypothetical protein DAI22_01g056008 [Oryza sativa Japonica Group]